MASANSKTGERASRRISKELEKFASDQGQFTLSVQSTKVWNVNFLGVPGSLYAGERSIS